jgi:DNA-binding PadR family transcriptional regulator
MHMAEETPISDVDHFLPLRPVEFHVLLSLCRRDRHGYGIMLDTEERTDGAMVLQIGTLYRALRRMKKAGLIADSDRRPSTEDDDERRNYYTATPFGREVAGAEAARLDGLLRAAREEGLIGASGK